MSISAIGGSFVPASTTKTSQSGQNLLGKSVQVTASGGNTASSAASATGDTAAQKFMAFMNESPEQQQEDLWLQSHGITKAQFDAMSPADQQKLIQKMKQDIDAQVKQKTEDKIKQATQTVGGNVDILA